ncbi:NAD-dependent epimerase/dehydratase family protein [Alkalicoccus urumqiensis]|uniref:Nucleoside-diphosphate-sugar epimerase n=1 Tax=Alkalicoccus urumqiensis TaxID=1548213 RepID=A0A2P6MLT9_ALKUR|nr:NAD(P)-dependent oxidoreductase [Alkalicoccus urumqiensis]PRO67255.1 nucleoside-diphosphate-sugar epimerase [Alkalicoccus urumqiensis]
MVKTIAVTGGSGHLGKWVVSELKDKGIGVVNLDQKKNPECRTVITDLTDLGQVYGALEGVDAVIHLGAIPVAYSHPDDVTFQNNVMSTYNVLQACAGLGIKKTVIASSESSYGIVFAKKRLLPDYVPVDEAHPQRPEDAYGLSKVVNEETADMFYRRAGVQTVSLRLGNVIAPDQYKNFPSFIHDAKERERILWSYIDVRDIADACLKAVEKDGLGHTVLNLAADDSSMDIPSRELMKERFPEVADNDIHVDDYETMLSNKKAKEVLGWKPVHQWRQYVSID